MNSVSVIVLSAVVLVERTRIMVISHLKLPMFPGGQVGEGLREPPENPRGGGGWPPWGPSHRLIINI